MTDRGSLGARCRTAGLPLARLRWAIPEEVLNGIMAQATGRKDMSAGWLKDARNQATVAAATYAMWGDDARARSLVPPPLHSAGFQI